MQEAITMSEKEIYPVSMGYLEIITTISKYNQITLKEAIRKYYSLTNIPSKEYYETIIQERNLFFHKCPVEITSDTDVLDTLSVPHEYAGIRTYVTDIDISMDKGVYYLLEQCQDIYFTSAMLKKISF